MQPISSSSVRTSRVLAFFAALLLFRIACVVLMPLDLVTDEAYYWDWSRTLDWCYYSKPPMVAWIIALSTKLLGASPFAVRLPAALFNVAAVAALFALGRSMFSPRVGFITALAFALAPGSFALGMIMTIDPPLTCYWALALLCTWRAVVSVCPGRSAAWWLGAGAAVALGFLSKQMMLVFPLVTIIFLVSSPAHRRQFIRPGFYLFLLVGLAGLLPVLWWNSQHEWVILQHSSQHFRPNRYFFDFFFTFFHFIGTQACVISPVLLPLLLAVGISCLATFRRQSAAVRFLLLFSIVPLLVIACLSLRQLILPNWPAVYYLAGCVLGAAWACGDVSATALINKARVAFKPGLWLGVALQVLAAILVAIVGLTGIGEKALTKQLTGWKGLGKQIEALYQAQPDRDRLLLMAKNREIAAELGFYMPSQPRLYEWQLDIVVYSQYHLWQQSFDKTNGTYDALLIWEARKPVKLLPIETNWFDRIEFVASVTNGPRSVDVYRGRNLRKWRAMSYHLPPSLAKPKK